MPHGGTFNANPVTMVAGLATMRLLDGEAFERLDRLGAKLRAGIENSFRHASVPGRVTGMGSLFRVHPMDRECLDYRSARTNQSESSRLAGIVRALLGHGHGVLVSSIAHGCLSTAMGEAEIDLFIEAFAACLDEVRSL